MFWEGGIGGDELIGRICERGIAGETKKFEEF